MSIYVQYGCGLSAPEGWINFDSSPTLRLQRIPGLGKYFKQKVNFPPNVYYGDIVKGLKNISPNSCDGIYCSHVLEHLSFDDLQTALRNTFSILKVGGTFRCVLPDLHILTETYLQRKIEGDENAANKFMADTMLGIPSRPRSIKQMAISFFGNSHHLWMWDKESLTIQLNKAGFAKVRNCIFNDSSDPYFKLVEEEGRFYNAVALEAIK